MAINKLMSQFINQNNFIQCHILQRNHKCRTRLCYCN